MLIRGLCSGLARRLEGPVPRRSVHSTTRERGRAAHTLRPLFGASFYGAPTQLKGTWPFMGPGRLVIDKRPQRLAIYAPPRIYSAAVA